MSLLLLGAAVAGCTTGPPEPRTAQQQAHLEQLIAGKVAGPPTSCLPDYRARDNMIVIDDNTLVWRDSARQVFVNNLQGGCSNLSSGHYALVTKRFGGMGMCRGDIAQVADVTNGFIVGSCTLGDFVPFTRPGR
jgi:hypothetical protein